MRVAVYDRFWSTAGGGEKLAGGIAQVLAADHDVDLLAHEPFDTAALESTLDLDLTATNVRVIGDEPFAVERASEDYDLLMNVSYTSRDVCRSRRGIYVVQFPGGVTRATWPVGEPLRQKLRSALGPTDRRVWFGPGFHAPERMLQRWGAWSGGDAQLRVAAPDGVHDVVRLDLARIMPAAEVREVPVRVLLDDDLVAEVVVTPPGGRIERRTVPVEVGFVGRGEGQPLELRLVTPTHRASDEERRSLGVAVVGARVGQGFSRRARSLLDSVGGGLDAHAFVDSYDIVAGISRYTCAHVESEWGIRPRVLTPPVSMYEATEKQPIILSVGRFFAARAGHSKKQLEMVEAFGRLSARVEGWELHLVGGVEGRGEEYLDEVRAAAEGLAVVIHPNATRGELADLYGKASIYWHATGLGESLRRHPARFEHFGITTVEAMSAAAVPIVIGHAGQVETVSHGVTGYHWTTPDELVELTAEVIADDATRQRLASAAAAAAAGYGFEAFTSKVVELVGSLD